MQLCARRQPVDRLQFGGIEAAGHDVDARRVGAVVLDHVAQVLRTLGDDAMRLAHELVFDVEARVGEAVVCALVQAANASQRMEGGDERRAKGACEAQPDPARHEEVRVDDVVAQLLLAHEGMHRHREGRHVREQLLLGQLGLRTGAHVHHPHAGQPVDDTRERSIVAARVDVDFQPEASELARDAGDVDVLSAGIHAAYRAKR